MDFAKDGLMSLSLQKWKIGLIVLCCAQLDIFDSNWFLPLSELCQINTV